MKVSLASAVRVCCILLACGIFIVSCAFEQRGVASQVCAVYKDMQAYSDLPISEREGMLTELVQDRLPKFFEQNFQYFMTVDWKEKPATMEKLLRLVEEDSSLELCQSVRDYYIAH